MKLSVNKLLFLFNLLFFSSVVFCDEQSDDSKWKSWVPTGWKLLTSAAGDLNQDNKSDAVLVFEGDNPEKRSEASASRLRGEANFNPRRLLILFQTTSGYRKVVETDIFLPSQNEVGNQCTNWDIEGVRVYRGQLHVSLHHEFDCGSGAGGDSKFIFRYQNGRFRLIGLNATSIARDIHAVLSTNYLTGRQLKNFAQFETKLPKNKRFIFLDEMKSAHCYDLSEYLSENKCKLN